MLDIRDHGGIFGGINLSKYKRWASGTATSSSTTYDLPFSGTTGTAKFSLVTVNGLNFKPSIVIMLDTVDKAITLYTEINDGYYGKTAKMFNYAAGSASLLSYNVKGDYSPVGVTGEGFVMPASYSNKTYTWIAYE